MSGNRYDDIPYQSNPFPQSQPGRLAWLGDLFGMAVTPVAGARILELGCASGGNLIPLAERYPGAYCLGIDLSERQIADGCRLLQQLGLPNCELRQADIMDLDETWGHFDYIICHGIFSWVPPVVQDKILQVCRQLLTANGIAYISYNTYPGWHIRGMVRDMMLFHSRQFDNPQDQLQQARGIVDFIAKSAPDQSQPYLALLQKEVELTMQVGDYYVQHDHLEEHNHPMLFHDFARKLAENQLQYLGEAEFPSMLTSNFAPEVAATLERIGANDIIRMEQYFDFLRCRYFRQTMVVRAEVTLQRSIDTTRLRRYRFGAPLQAQAAESAISTNEMVEFRHLLNNTSMRSDAPLTKAALFLLARDWPRQWTWDAWLDESRAYLAAAGFSLGQRAADEQYLGEVLRRTLTDGTFEFSLGETHWDWRIAERPRVSGLVRQQIADGRELVTTLRHDSANVDIASRALLGLLDGTRTVDELAQAMAEIGQRQGWEVNHNGQPPTAEMLVPTYRQLVEQMLHGIRRQALLCRQNDH